MGNFSPTRYGFERIPVAKAVLDSEFIATRSMSPTMPEKVFKFNAGRTIVGALAGYTGGLTDSKAGTTPVETGFDKAIYCWGVADDATYPARVVSNAEVPEVVYPGDNFALTIDDAIYRPDADFLLRDQRTALIMTDQGQPGGDGKVRAQFQVVFSDKTTPFRLRSLLDPGSPLNYNANKKGELSTYGQETRVGSRMDYYQTDNVIRHNFTATGHGLATNADDVWFYYEQEGNNGQKRHLALAMTENMFRDHALAVHRNTLDSKGNWNPGTRQYVNHSGTGARTARPSMSGFIEQMESSIMPTLPINPLTESLISIRRKITNLMSQISSYYGLSAQTEWLALTEYGGEELLQRVMADYFVSSGQTNLSQAPVDTMAIEVGQHFKSLWTPYGTIKPFNMAQGTARSREFDHVTWDGIRYNARGFDIFLVPMVNMGNNGGDGGQKRMNMRIMPRVHNGINRALVFGIINGMTGVKNLTQNAKIIDALERQSVTAQMLQGLQGSNISSPVDGETYMVLSHYLAIIENIDMVGKLEFVGQPSWA